MTLSRERLEQLARIARAVLDCPDVLTLNPGPTGRIASVTTVGRLAGLLLQNRTLLIGVHRRPQATCDGEVVAAQVRSAVAPLAPGLTVTVIVSASR